jgi:hypothetical protein
LSFFKSRVDKTVSSVTRHSFLYNLNFNFFFSFHFSFFYLIFNLFKTVLILIINFLYTLFFSRVSSSFDAIFCVLFDFCWFSGSFQHIIYLSSFLLFCLLLLFALNVFVFIKYKTNSFNIFCYVIKIHQKSFSFFLIPAAPVHKIKNKKTLKYFKQK